MEWLINVHESKVIFGHIVKIALSNCVYKQLDSYLLKI